MCLLHLCDVVCLWYVSLLFSRCHVLLFVTPWTEAHQASLSFTISQSLLKFISIELMMLSNHLILCHPVLLLPLVFPSIRVFSNESAMVSCCVLCLVHLCLTVTPWTIVCQAPLSMGILKASILEWVAMPTFKGSSQSRDRT